MVSGEVKKGEIYLYWIGKKEAQGTEIKIKTVDRSRLIKKLGKLTETEMSEIRRRIDLVFD